MKKIFVLGDSRTGTTTIHKFLKLAGFTSIHFFFKESGVSEPAHVEYAKNWVNLQNFIDNSGYDAFSDYPIRTFYKDLFEKYPDAYYILSTRKDTATWRRSMEGFFEKFKMDINLESLTNSYEKINDNIRSLATERGSRLCEVCIDDDAAQNGATLSEFLELEESLSLGWENSTVAYDNSLWSSRVTFFNTSAADYLNYVKRITHPSKAMLSEYGWVYLVNDSSNFLDYCFGDEKWTEETLKIARGIFDTRQSFLNQRGATYLKFAIPEKPVIYPQYLPKIFEGHALSEDRPALQLSRLGVDCFSYPCDVLLDARSFGNLYFRGDSHANWLGAYFIYHHVVDTLNAALAKKTGKARKPPFRLAEMTPALASYGGDLFTQLDKEARSVFHGAWQTFNMGDKIEYLVEYKLPVGKRKAQPVPVEEGYLKLLGERETFRFTHPNKSLPKAVIFRDSTSDYLVDLLAEHFSESLFIWHKGLVYRDVIEKEKPDVVLHIMAERFLNQYEKSTPFMQLGI